MIYFSFYQNYSDITTTFSTVARKINFKDDGILSTLGSGRVFLSNAQEQHLVAEEIGFDKEMKWQKRFFPILSLPRPISFFSISHLKFLFSYFSVFRKTFKSTGNVASWGGAAKLRTCCTSILTLLLLTNQRRILSI